MPVRTLRDIIRHGAEAYGSQTAFRYKVKKEIVDRTYLDVDRDSMAVSRAVEALGMKGKHIAVIPVDRELLWDCWQRQRGSAH